MKERPIIFSAPIIKAILEGRCTMTRRVINPQPTTYSGQWWDCGRKIGTIANIDFPKVMPLYCPYGQVGDRLWIKHRYDLFDIYYKPIEGFEGFYSAGTDGHIYRVDKGEPTVLQEAPTGDKGYLAVTLSKPEYRHTHFVHRLIAKTFYGMPPIELYQDQTRHLDGNNQNNLPANLDWGTQEDNWLDRKYHGRGMGEAHHSAKLTHSQARDISISTKSQRQLAHIYNVSQPTIQAVKSGKLWQTTPPQPHRNYPAWNGWKSPLFMPRWASRILLEITSLRAERLQEITSNNIKAEGFAWEIFKEGVTLWGYHDGGTYCGNSGVPVFRHLWDSLNAKRGYGWEVNPWVWVIGFKLLSS